MRKRKQPRKFHYTIGMNLEEIIKTKIIKLSTIGVNVNRESPAVFFSIDKKWENTANKMVRIDGHLKTILSTEEMIKYFSPLIRIEIDPEAAIYTWEDYVRISGIDKPLAQEMEKQAIEDYGSNVKEFWVSFQPIPATQWLGIDCLINDKWERQTTEQITQLIEVMKTRQWSRIKGPDY